MKSKLIANVIVNTDTDKRAMKGFEELNEMLGDKCWDLFQVTSVQVGIDTCWVRHYFWFRKVVIEE